MLSRNVQAFYISCVTSMIASRHVRVSYIMNILICADNFFCWAVRSVSGPMHNFFWTTFRLNRRNKTEVGISKKKYSSCLRIPPAHDTSWTSNPFLLHNTGEVLQITSGESSRQQGYDRDGDVLVNMNEQENVCRWSTIAQTNVCVQSYNLK